MRHSDNWSGSDVQHAHHALSIGEHRKTFPRGKWAMRSEAKKAEGHEPIS
ncbi:MAG: DUF2235 domain-containing protein [Pseudomonas balearica]|nr:DUF2235 domain-containing protein [Stutzerimonas balearica]